VYRSKNGSEWRNLFSGSVATAFWQLSGEAEAREASHSVTGTKAPRKIPVKRQVLLYKKIGRTSVPDLLSVILAFVKEDPDSQQNAPDPEYFKPVSRILMIRTYVFGPPGSGSVC
jgi:hypothetical protein